MQYLNKKIAILGLGQEALDLIDWLNFNSKDCPISLFDQKQKFELKDELENLPKVNLFLGKNYLKNDLSNFDIIFRSPGVHRLHPTILKAEKSGVEISSPTKLFFDLSPAKIIGVTGTKGKGTTTTLIHQILKKSGKKSFIAGNIGKPVLKLLNKLNSSDIVCLELSSFQLQDLKKSPHLSVVLNITSEHLDVHQTTKEYRQAKVNIVAHQEKNDFSVINADYSVSKSFAKKTKGKVFWFSRKKKTNGSFVKNNKIILSTNKSNQLIGDTQKLLLRGQHNWENITAAITASYLAGASLSAIRKTVFEFKGLEHRLELVRKLKGITFYNDSFSTTPETAIAAINSFSEPITIILGGSDKGSDFTDLGKTIIKTKNIKTLILIGQMAPKIKKAINQAGHFQGKIIWQPETMDQMVKEALETSNSGEVVILSPACASFDMFDNYKDRGNQFKKAVWALK